MTKEEPLFYLAGMNINPDGTNLSLRFQVPPVNTTKHNQFIRDMGRLQWFAVGHGYEQTPKMWEGQYEQEEYNCILRYLNKFGWKPAHECSCGDVVESFRLTGDASP